ncbi:MAG: three-Cys-motif partner protein TcmP [Planctomycetes bacterium]|nr:three-Cys-motif partner protein TcmP [Planctomycetota bacterium]
MNIDNTAFHETPQHLKQVSRIKHIILQKYLPPWAQILGSVNRRLCYFDCYAGPGIYELDGEEVDGSPIIAVKAARDYLSKPIRKEMTIALVEKDDEQKASLEKQLIKVQPYAKGLKVHVYTEDAKDFVSQLLRDVPNLAPSFFMVDPYSHPLTIPILNDILCREHTEALITFMYYRINMDAGNPKTKHYLDQMFGGNDWCRQSFLQKQPDEREHGFLEYFNDRINAKYKLPFRIRFDPEDRLGQNRTKYYLIHASNHPHAVLLMKDIMWRLGDQEGLFDYSATKQGVLFSSSPKEEELEKHLINNYNGREIEFDRLREETWRLPFIEKNYRNVIKKLKEEGKAKWRPVTSRKEGLRGKDLISFGRLSDIKE